jgi:hypothetical protein
MEFTFIAVGEGELVKKYHHRHINRHIHPQIHRQFTTMYNNNFTTEAIAYHFVELGRSLHARSSAKGK